MTYAGTHSTLRHYSKTKKIYTKKVSNLIKVPSCIILSDYEFITKKPENDNIMQM